MDQWILVVIACIAVIAPCITTFLNNRHQYKIAKLQTTYQTTIEYIENYFDSLGKYLNGNGPFSVYMGAYISASQKLYIVANTPSRKIIDEINSILYIPENWTVPIELNNKIYPKLNQLSKNLNQCL